MAIDCLKEDTSDLFMGVSSSFLFVFYAADFRLQ